jgi:hypothetical protein
MSKGGSRYGAGRPGYRVKAEHLQRVDIRQWHRGGNLQAGRYFSWSWTRGGEPTGSIGVRVFGPDSLRLEYTITNDGRPRDGSQTIHITRTFIPVLRFMADPLWFSEDLGLSHPGHFDAVSIRGSNPHARAGFPFL